MQHEGKGMLDTRVALLVLASVSVMNLIVAVANLVYFSNAHTLAVADRAALKTKVLEIQEEVKVAHDNSVALSNLDLKTSSMLTLITGIAKRQEINEVNIDLNHELVKKIIAAIPTTAPVNVPEQVPLPPRK